MINKPNKLLNKNKLKLEIKISLNNWKIEKITIRNKFKNQIKMLKEPLEKPSIPKKFLLVKLISNKLHGLQNKKKKKMKKQQKMKIVKNHNKA